MNTASMIPFRVVVADPPWRFGDKLGMSTVKRGAEANYHTLATEEIAAIPVASWCADGAVLALWTPSALLVHGLVVMEAWGFEHKQIYTWVKTTKAGDGLAMGMGRHFRGCTEHALIGTRGRPKPQDRSRRNVAIADEAPIQDADFSPSLKHSVKPVDLQDALTAMYGGPRLELFARRARPGWLCVGNEAPGFEGVDLRSWSPFLTRSRRARKLSDGSGTSNT